jgi:competence protein ComEC
MRAPFSIIPAVPIALGLIAGIIVFDTYQCLAVAVVAAVLFVVLLALRRHYAAFIAASVAIGWLAAYIDRPILPPDNIMAADQVTCYGYVTAQKEYDGARRCIVRVEAVDGRSVNSFNCATLTPSREPAVAYGDTVAFTAQLNEVSGALDVPHELDYSAFFKVDGVAVSANVLTENFRVIAHGNSLMCRMRAFREDLIDAILTSPLSPPAQTLLMACIAGDDIYISEQLKSDFRVSGIAHLLALSGFHIGIVVIIFSFILFPMHAWSHVGRWRYFIVIIAVWAYVCMLGLMPSVVRAATMTTIFLISKLIQRRRSPFNSIAVAAIAILIVKPYSLFSPGFQLSFAAVLAILLLADKLNFIDGKKHYNLRPAFSLLTVSFSAMLGTVVISAYYFHTIPLLFLPVNTVMALVFPVFMIGGLGVTLLSVCGVQAHWLAKVIDFVYSTIDFTSQAVASLPCAQINGIFLTPLDVFALLIAIAILIWAIYAHGLKQWLWFAIAGIASVLIIICDREQIPDDEFYILRPRGRTDILVRHLDSCLLITTANSVNYPEVRQYASNHYEMYFLSRNCPQDVNICDSDFTLGTTRRVGNVLITKDKTIALIMEGRAVDTTAIHLDYALITRGYKGKVEDVITRLHPDTILLSHDLIRPKRLRAIVTCQQQRQAYRVM